jgi:hypothetical protein
MVSPDRDTYLSNTGDHVGDKGLEGGDGTSVLVLSVPHLDSNVKTFLFLGVHLHNSHVDGHMAQVLGDGSFWSGNSDLSSLD